MKNVLRTTIATLSLGMGTVVIAAPAGTLLFTQPGSQIIGENGQPRPANRGDVVQQGERLVTPPGAISQVLLPDGSLVGMRPGAELKFDLPPTATDRATIVSLLQGSVRVIGSELMDLKKPSAFTFLSGQATLKLQGADLETALVKPQTNPTPGGNDAGSYSRLLIGTGSIGSGTTVSPLAPRQVSFVGTTNVAPVTLSSVSPTLFSPTITLKTTDLAVAPKTTTTVTALPTLTTAPIPTKLAPALTTSTLTTPLITSTALPTITAPPPVISPISTTLIQQPKVTTPTTLVATTVLPPPPVVIKPVYIAPVYIAPVTTITTCTISITGLKVCR